MIIDKKLIAEIESKRNLVRERPEYYLARANAVKTALAHSLREHSWWIENPDLRMKLLAPEEVSRGELIKMARAGISNLGKAWKYISQHKECFNPDFLVQVATLVDPINNSQFRQSRASLGLSFVPPNYVKVPELADKAFNEFSESQDNVIERAANLHLRLAGIQPVSHGNKRCARLYQDKVLHLDDLPAAAIPYGERAIYIDLLERGLISLFNGGDIRGRKEFYDYVGGKVNSALDHILNDLGVSK